MYMCVCIYIYVRIVFDMVLVVCIVDVVSMLCDKLCTHGRPQELRVAQISTWDFPLDVQIIQSNSTTKLKRASRTIGSVSSNAKQDHSHADP